MKVLKTKDKEKIFKEAREKKKHYIQKKKNKECLSKLCKPKSTELASLNTKEKKLLIQHSLLREYD